MTNIVTARCHYKSRDEIMVRMKNTASTPAQRQAACRANKKAAGFVSVTLRLDAETTARLRRLAKADDTTQACVIAAALALVDNKPLLKQVLTWTAERSSQLKHASS